MSETTYSIGEGPATRVSLSLPEGTAEAIRARVGKRELRGQILDEYMADYESRRGPVSEQAEQGARQVFDEVFAEEGQWPAAS